jgi:hypothetical protein
MCCKGSKTNTITGVDHLADGTVKEQKPITVPCFWCNGTGRMSDQAADEWNWNATAWCKCHEARKTGKVEDPRITIHIGTPDDQVFSDDGPCSYRASCRVGKHHYHCRTCGKITQIG